MRAIRLPGIHHDSNSILICDSNDGVLIDCGTSWYQLLIEERIRGQLPENTKISSILLTSRRFNHCGASSYLSSAFDSDVLIHDSAVNSLAGGDHFTTWASRFNSNMPIINAIGIKDGKTIEIGEKEIVAVHIPGHSIDSMGYFVETDGLMITGSTIPSENRASRWDLPTGCLPDLADSMELLLDFDLEILITGFGEKIKGKKKVRTVLEKHRDFFDNCIDDESYELSEYCPKPAQTVTYLMPYSWN